MWTTDPVWRGHVAALAAFPPGFSVLELCAGAGTATIALQLLLGQDKVNLAGAWDIAEGLETVHAAVSPAGAPVHLGKPMGDILATDLRSFPSANAVVCGPPCPPFSSQGSRKAFGDSRAAPFNRCIEVICELSQRRNPDSGADRQLMFFMLENVVGISHMSPTLEQSPLDTYMTTLRSRLGSDWQITFARVNTLEYGLPQSRPRIYVLGRRRAFYPHYWPARVPPPFARQVAPFELLDRSDNMARPYTVLQQASLTAWKAKYRTLMEDPANQGSVAFVEMGRDPSRTAWVGQGNSLPVDKCQCLRANGPLMHVFALGEGDGTTRPLSLDRPLRNRERAALQGFPEVIAALPLAVTTAWRVFGNAMSVPVLGSLIAMELRCILASNSRGSIERAMPLTSVEHGHAEDARSGGQHAPAQPRAAEGSREQPSSGQPRAADAEAIPTAPSSPPRKREQTREDLYFRHGSNEPDDIAGTAPRLRAHCVEWASLIARHWAQDLPGRAPRPDVGQADAEGQPAVRESKRRRARSSGQPQDAQLMAFDAPGSQGNGALQFGHPVAPLQGDEFGDTQRGSQLEPPDTPTHPGAQEETETMPIGHRDVADVESDEEVPLGSLQLGHPSAVDSPGPERLHAADTPCTEETPMGSFCQGA